MRESRSIVNNRVVANIGITWQINPGLSVHSRRSHLTYIDFHLSGHTSESHRSSLDADIFPR